VSAAVRGVRLVGELVLGFEPVLKTVTAEDSPVTVVNAIRAELDFLKCGRMMGSVSVAAIIIFSGVTVVFVYHGRTSNANLYLLH
jgi:hypothetical protein